MYVKVDKPLLDYIVEASYELYKDRKISLITPYHQPKLIGKVVDIQYIIDRLFFPPHKIDEFNIKDNGDELRIEIKNPGYESHLIFRKNYGCVGFPCEPVRKSYALLESEQERGKISVSVSRIFKREKNYLINKLIEAGLELPEYKNKHALKFGYLGEEFVIPTVFEDVELVKDGTEIYYPIGLKEKYVLEDNIMNMFKIPVERRVWDKYYSLAFNKMIGENIILKDEKALPYIERAVVIWCKFIDEIIKGNDPGEICKIIGCPENWNGFVLKGFLSPSNKFFNMDTLDESHPDYWKAKHAINYWNRYYGSIVGKEITPRGLVEALEANKIKHSFTKPKIYAAV